MMYGLAGSGDGWADGVKSLGNGKKAYGKCRSGTRASLDIKGLNNISSFWETLSTDVVYMHSVEYVKNERYQYGCNDGFLFCSGGSTW